MCFLALLYRAVPGYSVIVAANRDEYLSRTGLPPRELAPGVWGGQDPRAGGTWLGINRHGLVVGVANILPAAAPAANARSRGLLCMDALGAASARDARNFLTEEMARARYDEFNLLAADASSAWTATWEGGELRIEELPPGLHIIGNSLPDRQDDPKVMRGREIITVPSDANQAFDMLAGACRDHGRRGDHADAICVHGKDHGTLSSSLIAVADRDLAGGRYLFADGKPCQTPYADVSNLLRE